MSIRIIEGARRRRVNENVADTFNINSTDKKILNSVYSTGNWMRVTNKIVIPLMKGKSSPATLDRLVDDMLYNMDNLVTDDIVKVLNKLDRREVDKYFSELSRVAPRLLSKELIPELQKLERRGMDELADVIPKVKKLLR